MANGVKLEEDLQASPPEIALALSRAGVTGRAEGGPHPPRRRRDGDGRGDRLHGRPRSRPEGRPHVALPRALRGGDRGRRRSARRCSSRCSPSTSRGTSSSARARSAPRCGSAPAGRSTAARRSRGLATQEMVSLIGIAAASETGTRRVVGVEATGINACPCAQGLVARPGGRAPARGRLRRGRHRADPRARPDRDAQPARARDALRRHGAATSTPRSSSTSSSAR